MKRQITGLFVALLCLSLASCGEKSGSGTAITLNMKVLGTRALPETLNDSNRNVQTESRSFTPTSFKLPIMKISIAKSDGRDEQVLYQCANATEADCLVDLANQTALDAIATAARSATVTAGTYNQVWLNTCAAGSSGETRTIAKVTGSGTGPDNTTWTTSAANTVTLNSAVAAEETEVGNWSCSTKTIIVRDGIVVGTTPLTLTVVVDNFMASVFGSAVSGGMGGCKVSGGAPGGNGLCMTYPALMAYVGTDTVTTKRFSIAHDSGGPAVAGKANALVIIPVTSSGTPLMAYGRTLFTSTSEVVASNTKASSTANMNYSLILGGPTYVTETNVASFAVAANGKVSFSQGASADTFAAKFSAFDPTATHTGTVKSADDVDTWNYLATLLP